MATRFLLCPVCRMETKSDDLRYPFNCGWCLSVLEYDAATNEYNVLSEAHPQRVIDARKTAMSQGAVEVKPLQAPMAATMMTPGNTLHSGITVQATGLPGTGNPPPGVQVEGSVIPGGKPRPTVAQLAIAVGKSSPDIIKLAESAGLGRLSAMSKLNEDQITKIADEAGKIEATDNASKHESVEVAVEQELAEA